MNILPGLAAAFLFGVGAVLTKPLLADVHPAMMAGLLYLAASLGLGIWRLANPSKETSIQRGDLPKLAAMTLFGGVLGPVLLMVGLSRIPASSASLLLNLEAPLTALLAAALFGEHVGRLTGVGICLAAAGSAALTGFEPASEGVHWAYGIVAAAALCWALDNNLTQSLSERDPVQIAAAKGAAAGVVNVAAATALGASFPSASKLGAISVIGFMSYGASLACYLASLRRIGAAKTAMYFALAPFVGAALAILALGEPITPAFALAAAFMGGGVWLSSKERHEHQHAHNQVHEHLHAHDEHHRHHDEPIEGAHSHLHSHLGILHAHQHDPDIHHRH